MQEAGKRPCAVASLEQSQHDRRKLHGSCAGHASGWCLPCKQQQQQAGCSDWNAGLQFLVRWCFHAGVHPTAQCPPLPTTHGKGTNQRWRTLSLSLIDATSLPAAAAAAAATAFGLPQEKMLPLGPLLWHCRVRTWGRWCCVYVARGLPAACLARGGQMCVGHWASRLSVGHRHLPSNSNARAPYTVLQTGSACIVCGCPQLSTQPLRTPLLPACLRRCCCYHRCQRRCAAAASLRFRCTPRCNCLSQRAPALAACVSTAPDPGWPAHLHHHKRVGGVRRTGLHAVALP